MNRLALIGWESCVKNQERLKQAGIRHPSRLILTMVLLVAISKLHANPLKNDYQMFEHIFSEWTYAFNHKNLEGACALFAKSMTADYQGVPQKNYTTLCNGFKRLFKETNKQYQYRFKLHQVYHQGNLAAARITWYLSEFENGKQTTATQDEGLDIFMKNKQGEWKIINYLGYPAKYESFGLNHKGYT